MISLNKEWIKANLFTILILMVATAALLYYADIGKQCNAHWIKQLEEDRCYSKCFNPNTQSPGSFVYPFGGMMANGSAD